jgi:hypothetical protein
MGHLSRRLVREDAGNVEVVEETQEEEAPVGAADIVVAEYNADADCTGVENMNAAAS